MKFYRKKLGFSQARLAEEAGTAANYIAFIEVGKSFPSLQMLEKIAQALGVDALELFNQGNLNKESLKKDILSTLNSSVESVFKLY